MNTNQRETKIMLSGVWIILKVHFEYRISFNKAAAILLWVWRLSEDGVYYKIKNKTQR